MRPLSRVFANPAPVPTPRPAPIEVECEVIANKKNPGAAFFWNNKTWAPGERVRINLAVAGMGLEAGVLKIVEGTFVTPDQAIEAFAKGAGRGSESTR